MKDLLKVLFLLMLLKAISTNAQSKNTTPFFIKVKTDSGLIKRYAWEAGDSTLVLWGKKMRNKIAVPVSSIYYIKIKRPLLGTPLFYMAAGIILAGIITYPFVKDSHDNQLERFFLYSIAAGGSIGFSVGLAQAFFFKLSMPINKSQLLFEKSKKRLEQHNIFSHF